MEAVSYTPVHKGGSTDDPSNYRPIAVVSVVVKVLRENLTIFLFRGTYKLFNSHGAYRHEPSKNGLARNMQVLQEYFLQVLQGFLIYLAHILEILQVLQ